MAVTQYRGARYVPLFIGEWDETANYEPLCIVMHEGNSFTSRQAVPAGTSLDNEDYWAVTGYFNGQLADLDRRVRILEERINNG